MQPENLIDNNIVNNLNNIMDKLNNRPRKILNYATPNEVFSSYDNKFKNDTNVNALQWMG